MTTNLDLEPAAAQTAAMISILKRTALTVVFLWFAFGGAAHFALTEAEMRIVPPVIPWPRGRRGGQRCIRAVGRGGHGSPATRRAAGIGLFLLTIAVTPANVYMLQHAELFKTQAIGSLRGYFAIFRGHPERHGAGS